MESMRALIIEDEITTRVLLRRILSREFGCEVTECQNGLEALEALSHREFDFAVLDLRMPVLDGVETLDAIRQSPGFAALPVVVMTVEREEGRVRRVLELGISDYLLKPLRPDHVSDRVRQLMAKIAGARAAEAGSRAREAADGQPRLLVVDGDAGFRRLVAKAVEGWQVVEAESGLAGLKQAIELKPNVVLIGQNLGILGADLLLKKLRTRDQLHQARLCLVRPEGSAPEPDAHRGYDVTVERAADPDLMRARLAAVLPDLDGAADPVDAIGVAVAAALGQFFGMMLSLEVEPDPDPPAPGDDILGARTKLTVGDRHRPLEVVLRWDLATARRLAGVVLDVGADQATDEDLELAGAELARIVASRVKTSLEASGGRLTYSPAVPLDRTPLGPPRQTLTFRTVKDGLRYRVDFIDANEDDTAPGGPVPVLP